MFRKNLYLDVILILNLATKVTTKFYNAIICQPSNMLLVVEWEVKSSIWKESDVEKDLRKYYRMHDIRVGHIKDLMYESLMEL